jgi:hypothetical protein
MGKFITSSFNADNDLINTFKQITPNPYFLKLSHSEVLTDSPLTFTPSQGEGN